MTKRVFVIHGWGGTPESDWCPWVKNQLEQRDYQVFVPEMPDMENPKIDVWVSKLSETVGKLEPSDIFVTHSIGGQTVMRYLESQSGVCSKVIMVAPWIVLTPEATPEDEDKEIIKPWLETPIDFENVKGKANSFVAIFSDNDPYVSFEENSKIFKEKLGAQIVLLNGKGHFTGDDGINELPEVLRFFKSNGT